METQTPDDWLKQELEETQTHTEYDKLPSLQFVEKKMIEFEVDFSKPFEKWEDTVNKVKKAIIPVMHEGIKKNLWLNVKNPLYSDLIKQGNEGVTKFKVLQVGNQANTKYTLIEN